VKFTLSTRNQQRVVHQLRAFAPKVRKVIRDTVGEYAAREYQLAYDLCPKDTFFMADHLRIEFSRGGFAYELGWRERDFTAAGREFYPIFQEFGYRHWRSGRFIQNPSLFPARNATRPKVLRALERNIRQAVRRSQRARR
jgi:hypothetical protein